MFPLSLQTCSNGRHPRPLLACRHRWLPAMLSATVVSICLAGCGYVVGSPYGPEVRSVHVPTFRNDTYRQGFELQLTEAVQKQIELTTPYVLAKEPEADTRLVGRIVDISKSVVNQNKFDDPRELELAIGVEVRWEDTRTNRLLAERVVPVDVRLAQAIAHESFAPETGQSLATVRQDAMKELARDIVGLMEAPW